MTDPLPRVDHASAAEITIDPAVIDELRVLGEAAGQDLLAELVDQFVHDTESLLVQLREALEDGDALAIGRIAHSIKGSCGQLGGRGLASSCGRLEGKATAGSLSEGQSDLQEVEIDYQEFRRALTQQLSPVEELSSHILLVEDNPVNQHVARAMLEYLGFHVDVVTDGAEAVKAATLTPYQAILMDCQIPALDGYHATSEIRRLQGVSRRTPIIAVTASATKSDQQRCLAAGMDDYLAKPFDLEALAAVLARWAPGGSDPTIAVDPAETLPAIPAGPADVADPARPVLDAQVVGRLERLGKAAGEDLMGQLAILFLVDADARVVELRQASASDDAAAVFHSAHTLSGASANLGATELARLCATLETAGAAGDLVGSGALLEAIEAELGRVRSALGSPAPTP